VLLKKSKSYLFIFIIFFFTGCTDNRTVLEKIIDSGELRFVTISNLSGYSPLSGTDKGFEYELAKKFSDYLSVNLKTIVVPHTNKIIPMIKTGKAIIGAAGFVNNYAIDYLQFGPEYHQVTQQVVYRYGSRRPMAIDDIRYGDLNVTEITQYIDMLIDIEQQYPQFSWFVHTDKNIEELLDHVNQEEMIATVANSMMVDLYQHIYPNLRVAFNLSYPQSLVWVYKKQVDNSLHDVILEFFKHIKSNGELNKLIERYFKHFESFDYVDVRTYLQRIDDRMPKYETLFKRAAQNNNLDWKLLAAISYQESHWSPNARSPTGVRGLMMLTLDTAKQLGIKNRLEPKQSIEGGANYFKQTYNKISVRIQEPDRTWFALAAYNIGFAHLEDARKLAEKQGGDSNSWIDVRESLPLLSQKEWYEQTRHGKARGKEPVTYVENIRKYYDILRWIKYRRLMPDKKVNIIQALAIDSPVL
jgi:membrane-bound lytic murein transglycosylase F